ncbi:MAG: ABC transporter substrate binding protein [Syntrophomonadaceae bacterium]
MEPPPVIRSARNLFLAVGLCGGLLYSSVAAAQGTARRVIILTGTDVMLPASQTEDGVIRRILSDANIGAIEFYSEGLDAYRFHTADYEREFAAFLSRKYREKEPDLVFALTDLALGFLTKSRNDLWPHAPVVFTSVDRNYFQDRSRPTWATGILDDDSVAETVALARRLQPDARRILVVAGANDRDKRFAAKVARGLGTLRPPLEVAVRFGVPIPDYPREFGNVPKDTIVLYTMMFRDADGRSVVPRDAAKALAAAASVPVYGTHSTFLGTGILGGALFDYEYEGRAAAQMGLRILRGESPDSIPVLGGSPPLLAVDGRQLDRFGISPRRLPPEYEIRFRPPSFWQQYRWRIVAVGVALALETALLIALVAERHSRRRAEEDSRQRRQELAHASRLATVGELAASISHEINQPLGAILANAETAELLLQSDATSAEELRQILSDIRRDDVRASEVMRRVRALAGRGEIEMKPVAVDGVAEAAAALLEPEARRRGVLLENDFRAGPAEIRGDDVSLQQVIINLALNGMEAMAETPAGRRRLSIATRNGDGRVTVRVSDTGPGVAAPDEAKLFESFFTTKRHGLGLGLSICRSIIDAHGGRIGGVNNGGGGATFEFELPALPTDRDPRSHDAPA